MTITSHVLNTSAGKPAAGMPVFLYFLNEEDKWLELSRAITNKDGRVPGFELTDGELIPGVYKLRFETAAYFSANALSTFYPFVEIIFEAPVIEHYHVPLLLNPFGYSTYRGT